PILLAENQVVQLNWQLVRRQEEEQAEPLGVLLVELGHVAFPAEPLVAPLLHPVEDWDRGQVTPPTHRGGREESGEKHGQENQRRRENAQRDGPGKDQHVRKGHGERGQLPRHLKEQKPVKRPVGAHQGCQVNDVIAELRVPAQMSLVQLLKVSVQYAHRSLSYSKTPSTALGRGP